MSVEHQDLKPVILKSLKNINKTNIKTKSHQPNFAAVNFSRLEKDENYNIPIVTPHMGHQIVKSRHLMKLTQEELAKKCNIPLAILKQYEQGHGNYNRAHLDPISKILGITLSRPKHKSK